MRTAIETISNFGTYSDSMKRIFTIVKPGFEKLTPTIIKLFNKEGWNVAKIKTKVLLLSEAKSLYDIHKKEKWYEPLCKYMSSGPTTAIIFTKNEPMSKKVFDEVGKIKDEIRKKYGESDMRNVMHSSDSLQHMKHEMSIYF